MKVRKAVPSDAEICLKIYNSVCDWESKNTILTAWNKQLYPTMETVSSALARNDLYVLEDKTGTEKNKIVVAKAHKSNITCMNFVKHMGASKTYLATASFDKSIKIFTIEDGYKNIRTYNEAHSDYSIFSLDGIYNKDLGPIFISGNNRLKEIKVF